MENEKTLTRNWKPNISFNFKLWNSKFSSSDNKKSDNDDDKENVVSNDDGDGDDDVDVIGYDKTKLKLNEKKKRANVFQYAGRRGINSQLLILISILNAEYCQHQFNHNRTDPFTSTK